MSGWIRVYGSINPPEATSGGLPPEGTPPADGQSPVRDGTGPEPYVSNSPARRAWRRFRRNKLGFYSLVVFCTLVVLSLCAELVSNDRPLLVRYEGG